MAKKNHIDQIELRSEEVKDILTSPPHWMLRWGSLLFFLIILMLLIISWFVKYPDIVISQAVITTQQPPQKEYAKNTGKIDTIVVQNNKKVTEKTVLAVLENTANFQDVLYLKSVMDTITFLRKQETIHFPFDKLPILFLGELETDYALFENAYAQYQLNKDLQPFENELTANQFSVKELKRRLQNLIAQKKINEQELQIKKTDLDRYQSLFEKGVISKQEHEHKQIDYLQAERSYKNLTVSISNLNEAISNAQKTKKSTEINRTKQDILLLKSVIQSFNNLKKSLKNWELRYVLRSEIDGKVSFMDYWAKNQTVNQGDLVFTIIPIENTTFVAKLKTPVRNSGKIKIGQKVNIRIENYPYEEFGLLEGTISSISLVPDDQGLYSIDVQLDEKLITTYNKEIDFKQEMQGTAEIITENLRLIERFFYQFRKIIKR